MDFADNPYPADRGSRRPPIRCAILAAIFLLLPSRVHADIAPDPVTYVVIPSLFLAFLVFAAAALARLLLLLLRASFRAARGSGPADNPSTRRAEKGIQSRRFEKRAALVALLIGGAFFYWGYEHAWEDRRTRIVKRRYRSDLGAIRSTEVAFFAEWEMWVGNQPLTPVPDRRGNDTFVEWDTDTRFSILGFAPEGKVPCSYALEGPDWPAAAEGFTARAECDLDGDGLLSVWKITSGSTEITHSGDDF